MESGKRATFRCNICGSPCPTPVHRCERDLASCPVCGSNARWRAVVHVLSTELFGESLPLAAFPMRPDIVGIGMSDWPGYAVPLAQKMRYTNTFLHTEPLLDVTQPGDEWMGTLDFVISSDCFEHIVPPVSSAFKGLFDLLKPNGFVVFTTPHATDGPTREHFPDLHDYTITDGPEGMTLTNRTRRGEIQTFRDLRFHGGPGTVLEMRLFTRSSLIDEFARAGFARTTIYGPEPGYGIVWEPWVSVPWSARRGTEAARTKAERGSTSE
jgi:SAM-dependent methyltransferase